DWIRFAVADEVGAVEVDTDALLSEVFDASEQHNGCFLSRLETEIHFPPPTVRDDAAQRGDDFRIQRLLRVFGNESAMRGNHRDTKRGREIGALFQRLHALLAPASRDEADG